MFPVSPYSEFCYHWLFLLGSRISSSPYKYHRKVISNSEKKGFNSQSKFQYNQREFLSFSAQRVCIAAISDQQLTHKATFSARVSSPRRLCKCNLYLPGSHKETQLQLTSMDFCKQSNNVSGQTVFVSKTTRGLNSEKIGKWPSPYRSLQHQQFPHRGVSQGDNLLLQVQDLPPNEDGQINSRACDLSATETCQGSKENSFQAEILLDSAPAAPCKDPPSPRQYDLVDYKGSPKQDCSRAGLVPNTG
ncbi:LOW QUALITY PROTEIN: O(6)-methylguanine-induced apoptosis 2 [Alca torda]